MSKCIPGRSRPCSSNGAAASRAPASPRPRFERARLQPCRKPATSSLSSRAKPRDIRFVRGAPIRRRRIPIANGSLRPPDIHLNFPHENVTAENLQSEFLALPAWSVSAFIQLLEHHPWFEVAWLAASDRSAGQSYGDAVRWRLKTPIPDRRARHEGFQRRAGGRAAHHLRRARRRHRARAGARNSPLPAAPWSATPAPFACRQTFRWSFPRSTPIIFR